VPHVVHRITRAARSAGRSPARSRLVSYRRPRGGRIRFF
jgi:hypothetical protein